MFNNNVLESVDLSDDIQFQKSYEQYFTALKYFAMQYITDEDVISDLLQDFFLKLWKKGETFTNQETLKVYLYRGVRNNCITYLRNKKRQEKKFEKISYDELEDDFIERIIESEVFALLDRVFEELPEACKKVYRLSIEGKSHREIANELNIAINTIKRHKNNANHYIRKRLEKLLILLLLIKDKSQTDCIISAETCLYYMKKTKNTIYNL